MAVPSRRLALEDGWVDLTHGLVHRGAAPISLTGKETDLLAWLGARPGYAASREELQREIWGYADSIVSRTVDTTVRRLRMKIEADDANPVHLLTVHGVGYRFAPPAATPSTAPARPGPPPLAEASAFFGREAEIAAVEAGLRSARLVTLTGPPGIGKSRLATRMSRGRSTWWCDCADATRPAELAAALARVLRIEIGEGDLAEALRGLGPALLVLDGVEGLDGDARALPARWLRAAPQLAIVATSRRIAHLPGELAVELGPLGSEAALGLLSDRISGPRPPAAALASLVARVDAHPLALELAAARLLVLSPAQLEARLGRLLDLGGALRAGVQEAVDALTPEERGVLRAASVFRGGFTLEGLEAVADGDVAGALLALRERSLLRPVVDDPLGRRFALYDVVRELAQESDVRALADRHAAWAVAWAARLAALHPFDPPAARRGFAAEYANLRAALQHLVDVGDGRGAIGLVDALDRYLMAAAPFAERWGAMALAAQVLDQAPPWHQARLRILRADLSTFNGDYAGAEADLLAARAAAGDDPAIAARIHAFRGNLAMAQNRLPEAIALLTLAVDADESAARWPAAIGSLNALGVSHRHAGHLAEAEACYRRALEIRARTGCRHHEDTTLHNLATVASLQQRYDDAEATYLRLVGSETTVSVASAAAANLGYVALVRSRPVDAVHWFTQAVETSIRQGKLHRTVRSRWALALAQWWVGDLAAAEASLRLALADAARTGRADLAGMVRVELAALLARDRLVEAEATWPDTHPWPDYAAARRAHLVWAQGRHEEAIALAAGPIAGNPEIAVAHAALFAAVSGR
jgi:predicted ATPase/DNA-binding winged helix-turn-helix (wHTH) protein